MSYTFRKGINFARKLDKYYRKEKIFIQVRKASIIITLLTSIIAAILISLNLKNSIEIKNLTNKKKKFLDLLLQHSTESEKLFVISDKINFAKKIINTKDVQFISYYKAINDVVNEISNEATKSAIQIKNFKLNNNRNVSFEITTESLQGYLNLLDSIDEPKFLKLFEELTLVSFNITKGITNSVYTLKFVGKFKKLNS